MVAWVEDARRTGSDTIPALHRLRRATVAESMSEVRTSARSVDLKVYPEDFADLSETMVRSVQDAQTSPPSRPAIVDFEGKVWGMDHLDNALKSIAATSLSRSVDFPEEFRECPYDADMSSQVWARETAHRQESAPPGLLPVMLTRVMLTRVMVT